MVGLLVLAASGEACETALAARLDAILDAGQLPDLGELKKEFSTTPLQSRDIIIPPPNLDDYNRLLPFTCEARA
jgi:hypothetical protein